jgi:hypothetical protein
MGQNKDMLVLPDFVLKPRGKTDRIRMEILEGNLLFANQKLFVQAGCIFKEIVECVHNE